MSDKKTALIISAHAADFVWRCGGAIALHAGLGYEVTVACLSFGERGESAKLWKAEGMTLDKVKAARRKEAEAAANALDVHDIQFLDLGDYPLELDREAKFRLVDIVRVGALGRMDLTATFPRIFEGTHVAHPEVEQARARSIEFIDAVEQDVMVDGEIVEIRPRRLTVLPGAIDVVA